MRTLVVLILLSFICSCDRQTLSEEERKEIQKEIKLREPVKISDERLISKTFEIGRSSWKDTLTTDYHFQIYYSKPEDKILAELWDAYAYSFEQGDVPEDNVQLNNAELYYSIPLDSSQKFIGLASLKIPKKDVVLAISVDE